MKSLKFCFAASAFALSAIASLATVKVDGLHTMHLTNPVGIDAPPVFSWILDSDKRSVVQQSYNIIVATDPELSQVVWDSGSVTSSESVNVKAEGFNPQPSTRYYWGVTVTDNYGETASSTTPAYFETGLMGTGWSGAKWINALGPVVGSGEGIDPSTVKNYTVEADFEIERIAAGIIWGATDHNNYYMWQFNIERNPSKFRPHRWAGGGAACLAEIDVPLESNKVYHMKVEVSNDGTLAKTYLDGNLIDTREGSFPYGDMGVRSAQGEYGQQFFETAYYDDFKVTSGDKVLFEDHFDNRDNFDNGTIIGNELRVEGRAYAWQQGFTSDETVKDYTFEGKFTIDQVAAGIIFAGLDDSHYYMWQFNIEKSEPMFRPHRWNGGAACLEEVPLNSKIKLEQGRQYDFRIEVVDGGTKALTYLDNILIDEREGEYAYGRVGIRADMGEVSTRTYERSYYDNFKTTDESGEVIYSEDFDDPDNISQSAGEVIDGRFRVGAYGDIYSWAVDNTPSETVLHYTVEADMTLIKQNNAIVFSYTGSGDYFMWAINTKDHAKPCVRRHVYSGGTLVSSDTEINSISTADLMGSEHHVKIEVLGKKITTSIDGTVVDEFTATGGNLTDGKVGFRASCTSSEDERAYWDNVKVTVYDADNKPTVRIDEDFEGTSPQFEDGEIVEINGNHKLYSYSTNGQTVIFENRTEGEPILRKEFAVDGEIESAKLYTTALGNYNVFINGERVGTLLPDGSTVYDELMPGWTEYRKKVFYMTHDITSLVKEGANAIGVQLSTGWWAGDIAHGVYGNPNVAFMGKLVITLKDGSTVTVVSDDSWACSTTGPVKLGDIYHGETYDARDADDWATASYDAAEWSQVGIDNQFKGIISAYEGPAVRIRKHLERTPQTVTVYEGVKSTGTTYGEINVISTSGNGAVNLKKGQTVVYDLGQNFVGWVHFSVKGKRGTQLKMRFAEMLNDKGDSGRGDDGPGGSLYTINLRNAKCLLKYILSGDEEGEEYHPSTTFYGFRYCEITATDDITVNSLVGQVVGSEIEENGSNIVVNHDAVNQLYSNVKWGQRSNFLSVPTDCPQRDERLGWTADTQLFSLAASYNADVLSFYHKWMGDMRDSQREDGAYPDVAPYCWVGFGQAAWGDAGIVLPWNVYTMYGDKSIIEENFDSMERYMQFMANQAGGGFKYNGSGADSYGDWVAFEYTDRRYISVAYYGYMAHIMSEMAKAIGNEEKATEYADLFEKIKKEFTNRYLPYGKIAFSTQCAQLLALNFNLLSNESAVEKAMTTLRTKIEGNGNKLATGFIGTAMINQTLSRYGMDDLAYTLLLQRECPSWLYSVDQGATTIWERWDSYTKEKGFHSDITMNSFNHYAYGAVAEWMYRYMGGIAPDYENPGFKHIMLSPSVDNRTNLNNQQRITDVKTTFASPYGAVKSDWVRRDNGTIDYSVTVPANTTATVTYPLAEGQTEVYVDGVPVEECEDVTEVSKTDKAVVYNIGSGSYVFSPEGDAGIDEVISTQNKLMVTPNPAHDYVKIITTSEVESVEAWSISGAGCGDLIVADNKINVSAFAPGVYIIKVTTVDGQQSTAKVVKI